MCCLSFVGWCVPSVGNCVLIADCCALLMVMCVVCGLVSWRAVVSVCCSLFVCCLLLVVRSFVPLRRLWFLVCLLVQCEI